MSSVTIVMDLFLTPELRKWADHLPGGGYSFTIEDYTPPGKKPDVPTVYVVGTEEAAGIDPEFLTPDVYIFAFYNKGDRIPSTVRSNIYWLGRNPVSFEIAIGRLIQEVALRRHNKELEGRLGISIEELDKINEINQKLATEKNFNRLITRILNYAIQVTKADSGSIYLAEETEGSGPPTHLRFMRSAMQLDADEFSLPIDENSIAGYVAKTRRPLILDDVYNLPPDSPFSFNDAYDKAHGYYTKSMMVVPMTNQEGEIIGVVQIINRKSNYEAKITADDMRGAGVISFTAHDYDLCRGIAGQAAVAIDNQRLYNGQKKLLESFIQLIAAAIDSKSEYTGGHCARVPIITEMLARAACDIGTGPYKDFNLNEEEWYELRIAAGLHDCGKIVTPVHVMDKATKLETIYDRIHTVLWRIEVLKREAALAYHEAVADGEDELAASKTLEERAAELDEIAQFLKDVNIGGEYLADDKLERLKSIAEITTSLAGQEQPLLNEEELHNLSIKRGTLTDRERLEINGHMVETIKMLEALPFPKNLRRVPEYAGGHHEKMDGTGYPKGIYGGDMSIPARIMAIADVFEALTAPDRPYKKAKTLSETMEIMGKMKEFNHLDPELFDLFIESRVYLDYARQYLDQAMIDEVDEEALLLIKPKEFEAPPQAEREKRHEGFLPEYSRI